MIREELAHRLSTNQLVRIWSAIETVPYSLKKRLALCLQLLHHILCKQFDQSQLHKSPNGKGERGSRLGIPFLKNHPLQFLM